MTVCLIYVSVSIHSVLRPLLWIAHVPCKLLSLSYRIVLSKSSLLDRESVNDEYV